MSATIYGVKKWCSLTPDAITETIKKISTDNIYKGEDFYHEVESLDGWKTCTEHDDSVLIWNGDDAGQVEINGETFGLFVHYNDEENKFDWACTFEI